MNYRGRFSKGCESCRTRKVKCDEAKPKCSRCCRLQLECVYRDQDTLLFRNETTVAAQRAEESWRKRSKLNLREASERSVTQGSRKASSSTSTKGFGRTLTGKLRAPFASKEEIIPPELKHEPAVEIQALSISPAVEPDLCNLAYTRFLYDFVTHGSPNRPPGEPADAIYTFVPALYERAAPNSCLSTITQAVSYTNFANRFNSYEAATRAEELFGRGIHLLSKLVSDKQKAASDEVLCSTYLLGVYENLSNHRRRGTFVAHQGGMNALVQLRAIARYFTSPVSAALYEVTYTQMLLASLQAAKTPPIALGNIIKIGQRVPSIYNDSNIFVIQLLWREAKLHASWHEMKQSATPPTSRYELQELLQTALDLDVDYQAWEVMIPPTWRYQMQPNTPETRAAYDLKWQLLVLGSVGAPGEIHSHTSLKHCLIWGFYRTSRMFLLRDTLEILNWMFRMPEPGPSPPRPIRRERGRESASTSAGLDGESLGRHHTLTTVHMINLIEKATSAILSNFIVPVEGKDLNDPMGMRGYVVLWPLGTMDSILSSGLVPDWIPPSTEPRGDYYSLKTTSLSQGPSTTLGSGYYDTLSSVGNEPSPAYASDHYSDLMPMTPTSARSSPAPPSAVTTHAPRMHDFDYTPLHPNDRLSDAQLASVGIKSPRIMDVGARRQWINSMLYYIGRELGIRKALAVPNTEGYMPLVQPKVDEILGRR